MKFTVALLCIVGFAAAYDDGQWKGEGLAESQDYGQYDAHGAHGAYAGHYAGGYAGGYAGHYAPAPIGHDGRVVDTPEVAAAKAAHFAALNAASHGAAPVYGAHGAAPAYAAPIVHYAGPPAPLGHDGRVVDTPEVAHAKAAHYAAVNAAAAGAAHGYGHGYGHY